jgi:hypothetical protein
MNKYLIRGKYESRLEYHIIELYVEATSQEDAIKKAKLFSKTNFTCEFYFYIYLTIPENNLLDIIVISDEYGDK